MTFPAEINGHTYDVILDTGNESFLNGPLEDANKLDLDLVDVSSFQRTYNGSDYTAPLQYVAVDFPVRAFGRENNRGYFKVRPEASRQSGVTIGMSFLQRLVITFNEDATCTVTNPEQTDPRPTSDDHSGAIESCGAADSEAEAAATAGGSLGAKEL